VDRPRTHSRASSCPAKRMGKGDSQDGLCLRCFLRHAPWSVPLARRSNGLRVCAMLRASGLRRVSCNSELPAKTCGGLLGGFTATTSTSRLSSIPTVYLLNRYSCTCPYTLYVASFA
jgi:hypothetical protein